MKKKKKQNLIKLSFGRRYSGLLYLLIIALLLGVAANAFQKDDSILLIPMLIVGLLLVMSGVLGRYFPRR